MPDVSELPLRDIHLPGEVPWWPPAPGWWILAAFAAAALVAGIVWYYLARHRRAALREVRRIAADLERGEEPVACLQRLSMVMRRYAITSAASRSEAAGLTGERWLAYLDARWDRSAFRGGAGELLVMAPYARPGRIEQEEALELAALCRAWLAAQRVRPAVSRRGRGAQRWPLQARSPA